MLAFALIPASLTALVAARLHHSLVPDDPHAFPKYRVTFLNGLPILNETVQQWVHDGLKGGEPEFLDQPWGLTPPLKQIESAAGHGLNEITQQNPILKTNHALELMKFGRSSYLCLIPSPPDDPVVTPLEESQEPTPGHTWSLLQPLSGTCLYHRHGWFTYAYCHNSHVRQFRELTRPPGQRTGEQKPEEDPEWEAYTLGRAPPTLDPGADLTVAEETALAANVELARGPGARYLVQRWGDGTFCDKTGRKREIEVQFHCSMTTTDSIVFIKETQTCHYVLHIATPRLCGEPGFKNRQDTREEALIQCREIMSPEAYQGADRSLPPASHPYKLPKRTKPVIAPPPPQGTAGAQDDKKDKEASKLDGVRKSRQDLIRKALERLMSDGNWKGGEVFIERVLDGDAEEEIVIELIDTSTIDNDDGEETTLLTDDKGAADVDHTGGGASQQQQQPPSKKGSMLRQKNAPELMEILQRAASRDAKKQKDVAQSQDRERKENKKQPRREQGDLRGGRRNEL